MSSTPGHRLEVVRVEEPNPLVRRIVLAPESMRPFRSPRYADAYVKLALPSPAKGSGREGRATTRSYTLAAVDTRAKTVSLDVVRHEGGGAGEAWAAAARPGDVVHASEPRGKYSPAPKASAIVLVVDATGLPAARGILAAAAKRKRVHLVVDAPLAEAELDLPRVPGSLVLVDSARSPGALEGALDDIDVPWDGAEVVARGEKTMAKRLVGRWARERGVPSRQVSVSGYWSAGRSRG